MVRRSEATAGRETEVVVEDEEDGPVVVGEVETGKANKEYRKERNKIPLRQKQAVNECVMIPWGRVDKHGIGVLWLGSRRRAVLYGTLM